MFVRPRHVVAPLATLALACGGLAVGGDGGGGTAGLGGGGTAGGGGAKGAGGTTGGSGGSEGGCPRPPSAPVYACDAAPPDAPSCAPWESDAASPRYPLGCVVTTTLEGTFCGPVTCNCMTGLADAAQWLCPL